MGTVCVSASVETGRYTAETVKNDRITGYDRDIKDFRKGLADSAFAGAQKGAEAFVTAMDILSIVSGFKGMMGPKPPTAALAGADGEIIAVPEILEVDAGISILYSKSFPEGPFGEKKEVEEKEGVYVDNSRYKTLENELNFSNKALEHMGESGRRVPIQTLQDAIRYGKGLPDPRGSSATMYYTTMYKNGEKYNLEVLYNKDNNTVYHFKYTRKAIGNLPAISK